MVLVTLGESRAFRGRRHYQSVPEPTFSSFRTPYLSQSEALLLLLLLFEVIRRATQRAATISSGQPYTDCPVLSDLVGSFYSYVHYN